MRNANTKIGERERGELESILQRASTDKVLLRAFLNDLLTPAEMNQLIARWQIVKRLAAGVSQRQIARDLRVGIATITRGSRTLLNPKGGFQSMLLGTWWRSHSRRVSGA